LKQTTIIWPRHFDTLYVTFVQAPELEQTFSSVASFDPPVDRICTWIWSCLSVSLQCGWYQKVRTGQPLGTFTFCVSVLFPLEAAVEPICASYDPEWAEVTTLGR